MSKPTRHRGKWRIRWTDETGRRRSEVHLKYKDAELALQRHEVEAEERRRGLRRMRPRGHTLTEVWTHWSDHHGKEKRSRETDESIWRHHLQEAVGSMAIETIDSQCIALFKLHPKRKSITENTVNHHLSLLITLLRHAVEIGWLDVVPNVKKYRLRQPDFAYLRTADEVRRFLRAATDEDAGTFAFYNVVLHTGLRAGEAAGLQWDDIDLDRRLVTISRSYDGPTKGGEIRHIPIDDVILPILREHRLASGNLLVFPNEAGNMMRRDSRLCKQTLQRVLDRGGFSKGYITFHDLRHTFASHWMMNGGDVFKLQKILGHKDIKTTMRYSHLSPEAFAEDHDRLSALEVTRSLAALVEIRR